MVFFKNAKGQYAQDLKNKGFVLKGNEGTDAF